MFVRVNVLVDDLMAHLQFAFQLKPIGGLFWAERLRNNQIFLRRILKGTTAGKIAIRFRMPNFVQPMILLR